MSEFVPQDMLIIEDLETLKTIADPLRSQILERLVAQPQTVKEMANRLGMTPGRLYYHVNVLEEHGLIRVVDQRMIGNLVEKVYRATAFDFEVAPSLLSFDTRQGKDMISAVILNALDATRADLQRSLEARAYALEMGAPEHERSVTVHRIIHRIPESRAEEILAKLKALMAEFEAAAVEEAWDEEPAHVYAFTGVFYPRFDYPDAEEAAADASAAADVSAIAEASAAKPTTDEARSTSDEG